MTRAVRRLALGLAVAGSLAVGVFAVPREAAASCDPSYPTLCIAPPWELGYDLDCIDVGVSSFPVIHDQSIGATDPHHFDADFDGVGCEPYP